MALKAQDQLRLGSDFRDLSGFEQRTSMTKPHGKCIDTLPNVVIYDHSILQEP